MPGVLIAVLAGIGKVLLTILKIVLIVLLVIVVIILLLLFTPFWYKADFHKHGDDISGGARLNWLGFVFILKDRFSGKSNQLEIYLFGIPILRLIRYIKNRKQEKSGALKRRTGARKKPTVQPGERAPSRAEAPSPEEDAEIPEAGGSPAEESAKASETESGPTEESPKKPERNRSERGRKRLRKPKKAVRPDKEGITGKIKGAVRFLKSGEFENALPVLKKNGIWILRHILPRKISGGVGFGFDDPAITGKVLGAIALIYPVLPKGLQLQPDFSEKKLEADVTARGHFFLIGIVIHAMIIILNKDVRRLIRKNRKQKKA